jgi:hypothetical protein
VNAANDRGESVLSYASCMGSKSLIAFLIDAGAVNPAKARV